MSVKVTPDGSSPLLDTAAMGTPVDMTVKVVPADPIVNVVAVFDVIAGDCDGDVVVW